MLTNDRKHLELFDNGIVINKQLPKWTNANKRSPVKAQHVSLNSGTLNTSTQTSYMSNQSTIIIHQGEWDGGLDQMTTPEGNAEDFTTDFSKVSFDEAAKLSIKDLTAFINQYGANRIFGQTFSNQFVWSDSNLTPNPTEIKEEQPKKEGLLKRIRKKLSKKEKQTVSYEMDAIQFFENVKLTSKESMDTYRDRVEKYLSMLHSAKIAGQQALSEKLAREMFVNKYEAELYAYGLYYAVTEEQLVDFANKTEKGVSLIYLNNFTRLLPPDVIKRLEEMNKLEVFDNYAVLTYDPNGTKKGETEAEREKRKDPILFGLIAGSHKLYYICDWIDEKCDLTLQQLADTIEVDMEKLNFK